MNEENRPPEVARALADHPDLALFVATLFERLGGTLEIDEGGRRMARRPELRPDWYGAPALPQLADAQPWERFRSREEWEGAMKLAEYWLARLSGPDRDYVFTLLAQPAIDPARPFDFRDRL